MKHQYIVDKFQHFVDPKTMQASWLFVPEDINAQMEVGFKFNIGFNCFKSVKDGGLLVPTSAALVVDKEVICIRFTADASKWLEKHPLPVVAGKTAKVHRLLVVLRVGHNSSEQLAIKVACTEQDAKASVHKAVARLWAEDLKVEIYDVVDCEESPKGTRNWYQLEWDADLVDWDATPTLNMEDMIKIHPESQRVQKWASDNGLSMDPGMRIAHMVALYTRDDHSQDCEFVKIRISEANFQKGVHYDVARQWCDATITNGAPKTITTMDCKEDPAGILIALRINWDAFKPIEADAYCQEAPSAQAA